MWKPPPDYSEHVETAPKLGGAGFFGEYVTFLLKNVLGWVFILGSFVLGPAESGGSSLRWTVPITEG